MARHRSATLLPCRCASAHVMRCRGLAATPVRVPSASEMGLADVVARRWTYLPKQSNSGGLLPPGLGGAGGVGGATLVAGCKSKRMMQ